MIKIAKSYSFDAAHLLWVDYMSKEENEQVFGKCSRLHGHTYKVTVEVTGEVDPNDGMILNYFDLDKVVKPIIEKEFDHHFLNEGVHTGMMLTTAENLVGVLRDLIEHDLPNDVRLSSVTLQETPKTYARWERA